MQSFHTRVLAYGLVILLGLGAVLPSLLSEDARSALPDIWASRHINPGLDLRGGSHLLLEVDTGRLAGEHLQQLANELGSRLDEVGLRHSRATLNDDSSVTLRLTSANDLDAATHIAERLAREQRPTAFNVGTDDNRLTLAATYAWREALTRDAVERSLEVVRRRMDETGVVEPLITRQGSQGVLVQMPGVTDPGEIKRLLGRTAVMTFHLVADQPGMDTQTLPDRDGQYDYPVQRTALLKGEHLEDARLGFDDRTGEPLVTFHLNRAGAQRFADITRTNVGRAFAVVLDGEVITAPVIRSPITGGNGQISGGFSSREASELALLLRAGALPAPLNVVEERTVGPELGSDTIRMGVTTGLLGAALVLGFMVVIYGRWGLIANTALVLNVLLTLGLLGLLGATLTLPGIAGLILSIGMAVDANILINERIREETRRGRRAMSALNAGFDRAFGTIVDASVTTLIAVSLLFMFGSGPIRGFAVTMGAGLLVSMFTAVGVTRLLMTAWVRRHPGQLLALPERGLLTRFSEDKPLHFMRVRGAGLLLSILLSLASVGLLFAPGLNQGIDFKGGTAIEINAGADTTIEPLRAALLDAGVTEASLQQFGDAGQYRVRLPAGTDNARIETVQTAVRDVAPDAVFPKVDNVGPSVSGQFLETSLLAVLLAGGGMFLYLRLRFASPFATAAMATLALDLTKTLGFLALTGIEFNLTAIAALLALIGYSVNDKVVVFDRMREQLALTPDMPLGELINRCLTGTLTRTLFTSATTFLALVPMAIAGGDAVASFALPMLFGIVVGTGSSIFIAAPLVLRLGKHRLKQDREAAKVLMDMP
ncbi:MAG: protein translocase subunit SecD [Alcanivorax sp.]|nr:protein translocase subunit SecD [Alcanivorax sp.]